jgi:hypothetical protein
MAFSLFPFSYLSDVGLNVHPLKMSCWVTLLQLGHHSITFFLLFEKKGLNCLSAWSFLSLVKRNSDESTELSMPLWHILWNMRNRRIFQRRNLSWVEMAVEWRHFVAKEIFLFFSSIDDFRCTLFFR